MWTVWGGRDKREGQFGRIEPQKGVKVVLIEWRSIDLHLINSKSTFHPTQSGKRTGTYSACILGVRLSYQCHGEHGLKVQVQNKCIQYRSVLQKKGFASCSFHFIFCYVLIKIYLGNLYHWKDLVLLFQMVFLIFVIFFSRFFFGKTYLIQYTRCFCRKPFAQPRSSTTRKEHAVLDDQKLLFKG